MQHLSLDSFERVLAGRTVPRASLQHLDRCMTCRKAYAARGGSQTSVAGPAAGRTRLWAAGVAAIFVACSFALSPVRGLAASFLQAFEPRAVAFVPVTSAELRTLSALPDLSRYGDGRELYRGVDAEAGNPRAASALARYAIRVPSSIAERYPAAAYHIFGSSVQQFTFSARRARQAALASRAQLSPLPPGFDGSTLRIATGAAVVATYSSSTQPAASSGSRSSHTIFYVHFQRRAAGSQSRNPRYGDGDAVVVAQMPAPRITSTGVTPRAFERFMLQQPGISPRLAASFEALGDPATTLPIPLPIDKAYGQPVFVDGVAGLGIGDDTGLGAGVVWQRGGMFYGVFGTLPATQVLAIANSLR